MHTSEAVNNRKTRETMNTIRRHIYANVFVRVRFLLSAEDKLLSKLWLGRIATENLLQGIKYI